MAYKDKTQGVEFAKNHPEELRELGLVRVNREKLVGDVRAQLSQLMKLRDKIRGKDER